MGVSISPSQEHTLQSREKVFLVKHDFIFKLTSSFDELAKETTNYQCCRENWLSWT